MAETLIVGDRMQITTELLKDIHAQPAFTSVTVKVVEIRDEKDGTKTLVLERADL